MLIWLLHEGMILPFRTQQLKRWTGHMSHFNGLGALKAVLINGTNYGKIDNILYRY